MVVRGEVELLAIVRGGDHIAHPTRLKEARVLGAEDVLSEAAHLLETNPLRSG